MSDRAELPDLLYSDTERALADSIGALLADRGEPGQGAGPHRVGRDL